MIKVWLGYLVRLPKFLFLLVKDLIPYIKIVLGLILTVGGCICMWASSAPAKPVRWCMMPML